MVEEAVSLALHVATGRSVRVNLQFDPLADYALADKV
jgi:hypothetical protein